MSGEQLRLQLGLGTAYNLALANSGDSLLLGRYQGPGRK